MYLIKNSKINKIYYLVFLFFYSTLVFGFFLNEDSIGGAKHDYYYHLKFINLFKENSFVQAINQFSNVGFEIRNSPVFYILYGLLNNYLSLELLHIINFHVVALIAFFFFKCLKIRFKNVSNLKLSFIACLVFLSPTLRSLAIWPYPLIWALLFFLISIFFYLKFIKDQNNKLTYAINTTVFIVVASYFHPPLSLFNFFFLYIFLRSLNKNNFIIIIILNIFFSLPAIIFLYLKGPFFFGMQGGDIPLLVSLNPINKVVIISTIIFFFIIPILNFSELYKEVFYKITYKNLFLFVLITICFYPFFNYSFTTIHGGGFFHKISNLIFGNNVFLFLIFFLSLIVFYILFKKKFKNYLLFFLIILTNLQYTIYNKYYDVLVIILFFLLFEVNINKFFFNKKYCLIYLYCIYFLYYLATINKNNFYNLI